ncbi:MFS general substrate transporter [Panus rudis PR-1116 ss-1]|nr:MFS general substrate transporter [Panus rudis PR-1116 ss-1]
MRSLLQALSTLHTGRKNGGDSVHGRLQYQLLPTNPTSDMGKKTSTKRPWRSYIWDTWDKPPEERKFLAKLDACLLTYAALSYFSKYLDQQNVTNAYVSGMKEDLGLHGNQLNYITTAWTCGYVIGQIPSNLLITRIRPSIWIPMMEVIWSALTMVLASAKNFETLVAVRFFVGLAESTFYPAIQYVIGSWYKSEELGKRACIFHTASAIGPMFSGFLQAGAYNGLNNVHGLAGWRWLFIIDGIITLPIAFLGFLIMPDLPSTTKPNIFYTQKQIDIAVKRMEEVGRKPPARFTKKKIIGFFKTWHIYLLVPLYVLFNNGGGPATSMIFWLQSFNTPGHQVYTVSQINTYPLGIQAFQIVTTLIWAWWSDAVKKRWPPMILAGLWQTVNCIVLASTPLYTHITRRWIFYYFTSVQGGLSGLILAWANELTGYDNEKRSFVVACCNTFAYVFQAWLPIIIFPQVEQPRVFKGNVATACISFSMVCVALTTLALQTRDERRAAALRPETPESIESSEDLDIIKKTTILVDEIATIPRSGNASS